MPTPSQRWKPYPRQPSSGISLLVRRMLSPQLRNFRNVIVALPPGYDDHAERRYPVIYMQDGQNLFDSVTSYAGDWRLSDTLATLSAEGTELIVVAVANAPKARLYEYSPFADRRLGGGGGDRYLDFLIETVKPAIDHEFRTRIDRDATAIAGSSMGGLISLYAAHGRGEVFGSAGVLSPSLWFANRRVIQYIESFRGRHRPQIYLDVGLGEPPGAVTDVRRLKDILERIGHRLGESFEYLEDPDGRHDEATWARRFKGALSFMFRPPGG